MPKEYTVVDFLGQGAYGCVCAVRDSSSSTLVAVKKCKSIFQSRTLAKRTLREVRLLRLLVHPNIVRLRKVIQPRFEKTFSSLYLVFDLMETDLASIIRSTQPLSDRHVQYFTLQLLRGCKHMHENMVWCACICLFLCLSLPPPIATCVSHSHTNSSPSTLTHHTRTHTATVTSSPEISS